MQRVVLFLLVLLAVACQKEQLPTQESPAPEKGRLQASKLNAVKIHVASILEADIAAQVDWNKIVSIEKNSKLMALKVPLRDVQSANYHFLIINMDKNGNPASISRNIVRYQSRYGLEQFPTFVMNKNYATGKTKEYLIPSKPFQSDNGNGRNIRRLSLEAPGSTLPMVTVVGTYANGTTGTLLTGTTAYIMAAMLGMEGSGGTSGTDGTGNGDPANSNYTNLDYIDPLSGGSGGGSTYEAPPIIITWELDESEDKPAINLEQYLKCFDAIPDAGASFQVKVYVDIPVNQTPDVLIGTSQSTGEFGPGHVFMKLTKINGSQSVSQVIGFYPGSGLKSATMNPVPSKIVNDGNAQGVQHEFNASLTMADWNADEFRRLLNELRTNSTRNYELDEYNCANFVAGSINAIRPGTLGSDGVAVYDPTNALFNNTIIPFSPNGMYKALSRQKYSGGPYANNIDIGVNLKAQASNGPCN